MGTATNTIQGTNVRVSINVLKYKGKGDSDSAKRYRNKVIDGEIANQILIDAINLNLVFMP